MPCKSTADVLVIGGGVTGVSAAYHLAKAGARVTLVERHDLNTQASGSNAGGLHGQIQYEPFLERGEDWARPSGRRSRSCRRAIRHWQELERELDVDLEVIVSGGLHRRQPTTRSSATSSARPRSRRSSASRSSCSTGPGSSASRRTSPTDWSAASSARSRGTRKSAARDARARALGAARSARPCSRGPSCTSLERTANGGFRAETSAGPIELRTHRRLRRGRGGRRRRPRRRRLAGRAVPAAGLRDRAGAAARLASRLLRRRPVDAETGPAWERS